MCIHPIDHRDDAEYVIQVVDQLQYGQFVRAISSHLYISAVHGLVGSTRDCFSIHKMIEHL